MSLTFSEGNHQYRLDGKYIPGVTTLIKQGLPKEALMYWSARKVAEYVADNAEDVEALRRMGRGPMISALKEVPWQARDEAAVRGTDIHAIAEQIVHGERVEVSEHLADYVSAAARFLDDWQIAPVIVERPVAHRAHWWAGTPDLFADSAHGIALFDYKTADSGIWSETAFQLAAYRHAEFWVDADGTEKPIPQTALGAAVWLQPNHYEVIPLKSDDDVYTEFRHIAAVARAAKRAKGSKTTPGYVGAPLTPNAEQDIAS